MALGLTTAATVTVRDTTQNINLSQSNTVTDTTADLNFVVESYNLPAAQATYQAVTVGDIVTIKEVFISVTTKTAGTFAGVSLSLTSGAGAEIVKVWDSFVLTGRISGINVKNLDPTNPVTIMVVLGGTNA